VMMKAAGTDWPRANVLATATQYSGRNIIAKWRELLNRPIN
jgi:hypothetical protein